MGVLSTTMPPVLETYQYANVYGKNMKIYFSPSPFNNLSRKDTWGIHVVVRRQTDNRTAFKFYTNSESQDEQTQYLNSIIAGDVFFVTYFPESEKPSNFTGPVVKYDSEKDMYYFEIKRDYIEQNINSYYQIQLRYDTNLSKEDFDLTVYPGKNIENQKNLALVYNYLVKTDNFSEWSTVSIIKCIYQPKLILNQFLEGEEPFYQWGLLRLTGNLKYFREDETTGEKIDVTENSKDNLQWYQIRIFDSVRGDEVYKKEVYTLEQIDRNSINCILNFQNFANPLTTRQYKLEFSYTTTSNYVESFTRNFTIGRYTIDPKFETTQITVWSDEEEGNIHLSIINNYELYGTLYVRRASAINNFEDWTDLYIKDIAEPLNIDLVDKTIQSLTYYKYSLQYENKVGIMSQTLLVKESTGNELFSCDYEDNFIYRDKIQLPLRGDFTISNYKPVVNRAKIDTLGKRYPKFAENANLNYKQFSISGDITSWHDVFRSFLSEKAYFGDTFDKYQEYKRKYNIKDIHRNDYSGYWHYRRDQEDIVHKVNGQWLPSAESSTLDNTVFMSAYQDIYWEREFREKAIQWLNDGEPKLMKTQPEGAIVVMLTDVALTPKQQLGRLLYSFSATAYEVEDATSLEILDELGIIHIHDEGASTIERKIPGYLRTNQLSVRNNVVSLRQTLLTKIQNSFQGVQGDYKIDTEDPKNFILHNVKLFITGVNAPDGQTVPQYYEIQLQDSPEGEYKTIKVPLIFHEPSPDNNTLNSFYQIPDTIDVYDIKWTKGADNSIKLNNSNHIEFVLEYQKEANTDALFSDISIDRTTIGQVFLEKIYQEDIAYYIKNKYKTYKKKNNNTEQIKEVGNWRAVQIDGPPMTIIQCKQEGLNNIMEYVIGYDGVLNLRIGAEVYLYKKDDGSLWRDLNQDTYNLENLYVLGRRFTIVDNDLSSLKPWEIKREQVKFVSNHWVAEINETYYKFNVSNNNVGTSGLLEIPVIDLTLNYMVDVFSKERKGES